MSTPHEPQTTRARADLPPLRREIRVSTDIDRAFRLFTGSIGEWWPVSEYSVFAGTVAFEGEELVERKGEERSVWAEVLEWDAPRTLALAWHPGSDPGRATHLRISFSEDSDDHGAANGDAGRGAGTIVTLTHSGWERSIAPEQAAREYGEGWPVVLSLYAALVTETFDDADDDTDDGDDDRQG